MARYLALSNTAGIQRTRKCANSVHFMLRNIIHDDEEDRHASVHDQFNEDDVPNGAPDQWSLCPLLPIMLVPKPGNQSAATDDKSDCHLL